MRIAILGWGSLVWDPRDLPHYGPWRTDGPRLPLEFSRVSQDCRLTLVINPIGPVVATRFAISPRSDLRDAVEDLRRREGTTLRNIGFVTTDSSLTEFSDQTDVVEAIVSWCRDEGFEACVWTALVSNFSTEFAAPFSVEEAVRYLERLPKTAQAKALAYIRNAPEEVDTPVRREVMRRWPVT